MSTRVKPGAFFGRPASPPSNISLPKAIVVKHRSTEYLAQQTERVHEAQRELERALADVENARSVEETEFYRQHAIQLKRQCDIAIIRLAAAHKLEHELKFARNKLKTKTDQAEQMLMRKRIAWLEQRVKDVVVEGNNTDDSVSPSLTSAKWTSMSAVSKSLDRPASNMDQDSPLNRTAPASRQSDIPQINETGKVSNQESSVENLRKSSFSDKGEEMPELSPGGSGKESRHGSETDNSESSDDGCRGSSPKPVFITETSAAADQSASIISPAVPRLWTRQTSDACDAYWSSEHHRLAQSSLRHVDSLFYHKMALAVQGTYVNSVQPTAGVPPQQGNADLFDTQTKALNDLSVHVGRLCDTVREASKLSIIVGTVSPPAPLSILAKSNSAGSESKHARRLKTPSTVRSVQLPALGGQAAPSRSARKSRLQSFKLPLAPTNWSVEYPQSSEDFSASIPGIDRPADRIVDQRNLLEETRRMTCLFHSKRIARVKPASVESRLRLMISDDVKRFKDSICCSPFDSSTEPCTIQVEASKAMKNNTLQWARIQDLVDRCRTASRPEDRVDCVKQLGALQCVDKEVTETLRYLLEHELDERVSYEAVKALANLGLYSDDVLQNLIHFLLDGTRSMKLVLIQTIIRCRHLTGVDAESKTFNELLRILGLLCRCDDEADELSFSAAVSLHRLGVANFPSATRKLDSVVRTSKNIDHRAKALSLLLREVHEASCPSDLLDILLEQLQHSVVWQYRHDAANHLVFLGLCGWLPKGTVIDVVYNTLLKCVCSDVNKAVRLEAAKSLTALGMIGRACNDVDKMLLNETSEKSRSEAIIAIGILGMKNERIIKTLLDMADLDVSHHVRLLVIRTFGQLNVHEEKILCLLRTKADCCDEKLSREARRSLKILGITHT